MNNNKKSGSSHMHPYGHTKQFNSKGRKMKITDDYDGGSYPVATQASDVTNHNLLVSKQNDSNFTESLVAEVFGNDPEYHPYLKD